MTCGRRSCARSRSSGTGNRRERAVERSGHKATVRRYREATEVRGHIGDSIDTRLDGPQGGHDSFVPRIDVRQAREHAPGGTRVPGAAPPRRSGGPAPPADGADVHQPQGSTQERPISSRTATASCRRPGRDGHAWQPHRSAGVQRLEPVILPHWIGPPSGHGALSDPRTRDTDTSGPGVPARWWQ